MASVDHFHIVPLIAKAWSQFVPLKWESGIGSSFIQGSVGTASMVADPDHCSGYIVCMMLISAGIACPASEWQLESSTARTRRHTVAAASAGADVVVAVVVVVVAVQEEEVVVAVQEVLFSRLAVLRRFFKSPHRTHIALASSSVAGNPAFGGQAQDPDLRSWDRFGHDYQKHHGLSHIPVARPPVQPYLQLFINF